MHTKCLNVSLQRNKFAHLADSQAGLGVLTKCRSSSKVLQRVVEKVDMLCLATESWPVWGYAETDKNPADALSRRRWRRRGH